MEKMTKLFGLLALSAMAMISCQKQESPEVSGENKVFVSVGASLEPLVKASVINENGTRTLTFTEGDRLYVRAEIGEEPEKPDGPDEPWKIAPGKSSPSKSPSEPRKMLAGFLDYVPAGAGATSAMFSGELSVWEENENYELVSSSYTFTSSNPLNECYDIEADFISSKAAYEYSVDSYQSISIEVKDHIASSVEEVMERLLPVSGEYDKSQERFVLSAKRYGDDICIFNCTVSGLTAGANYSVLFYKSSSSSNIRQGFDNWGEVTADADGIARFAAYTSYDNWDHFFALSLRNRTEGVVEWKYLDLGEKYNMQPKIYTIEREATVDPLQPVLPVITGASYTTPSPLWGESTITFDGPTSDMIFSMAGTNKYTQFSLEQDKDAIITLSKLTSDTRGAFLTADRNVTLILDGNSTLTCSVSACVLRIQGSLRLKTTGRTQTLTVAGAGSADCGFSARTNYNSNNNNYSETGEVTVDALAADGFKVTRGPRIGTYPYTWVYTVEPIE